MRQALSVSASSQQPGDRGKKSVVIALGA